MATHHDAPAPPSGLSSADRARWIALHQVVPRTVQLWLYGVLLFDDAERDLFDPLDPGLTRRRLALWLQLWRQFYALAELPNDTPDWLLDEGPAPEG